MQRGKFDFDGFSGRFDPNFNRGLRDKFPEYSTSLPLPGNIANDAGDLYCKAGRGRLGTLHKGSIWVTTEQAMEAAKFGWKLTGRCSPKGAGNLHEVRR